jgi:hypothetical protein
MDGCMNRCVKSPRASGEVAHGPKRPPRIWSSSQRPGFFLPCTIIKGFKDKAGGGGDGKWLGKGTGEREIDEQGGKGRAGWLLNSSGS